MPLVALGARGYTEAEKQFPETFRLIGEELYKPITDIIPGTGRENYEPGLEGGLAWAENLLGQAINSGKDLLGIGNNNIGLMPKLFKDNPGGDWLKQKLEDAQKDYDTAPIGTASRNIGASNVTGYFEKILNLPPDLLKDIPGAMGEETSRGSSLKLKRLQKSIVEEGYKPSPILISVREDGKPFVVEGNHRIAEAVASDRTSIPVEIKYLRGGEDADGPLSPSRLQDMYGSVGTNEFAVGGLITKQKNFQSGGLNMARTKEATYDDTEDQMNMMGFDPREESIDPVSGNEVPLGGTSEGVRDNIDVKMSKGEMVIPEYAVNYHGVETYINSIQKAQQGYEQMQDMGLMGNPDEAIMDESEPLPKMKSEEVPEYQTGGLASFGDLSSVAVPQLPTSAVAVPQVAPASTSDLATAPLAQPLRPTSTQATLAAPKYPRGYFMAVPESADAYTFVSPPGSPVYTDTYTREQVGASDIAPSGTTPESVYGGTSPVYNALPALSTPVAAYPMVTSEGFYLADGIFMSNYGVSSTGTAKSFSELSASQQAIVVLDRQNNDLFGLMAIDQDLISDAAVQAKKDAIAIATQQNDTSYKNIRNNLILMQQQDQGASPQGSPSTAPDTGIGDPNSMLGQVTLGLIGSMFPTLSLIGNIVNAVDSDTPLANLIDALLPIPLANLLDIPPASELIGLRPSESEQQHQDRSDNMSNLSAITTHKAHIDLMDAFSGTVGTPAAPAADSATGQQTTTAPGLAAMGQQGPAANAATGQQTTTAPGLAALGQQPGATAGPAPGTSATGQAAAASANPAAAAGVQGVQGGHGQGGVGGNGAAGGSGGAGAGGTGGPSGQGPCFIAGTELMLEDKRLKKVEDIEVGDKLCGAQGSINKVTVLHKNPLGNRSIISVNGSRFFCTEDHPFKTNNGWQAVNAEMAIVKYPSIDVHNKNLGVGDIIENHIDEENTAIHTINTREVSQDTSVYNFTLSNDHTYITNNFVMHNKM